MSRVTSTPARGRRPGAPDTRAAVLAAARSSFAEKGFRGTTIRAVASAASVDPALVHHYFGSKDDLFLAVLERTYADIREAEQQLHLDEIDPVEAIRQLVSFTWHYYLEHPEFITLLNSENLHCAAHLKRSERIQEMNSPLVQLLDTVLERGKRDKLFRAGVDPVQLYISIASLCYFYLSNNHTLSAVFGRDLRAPKAMAQRLSHMTDLVLGYVLH